MNDNFIRSLPLVASALGRKYGLKVIIGGDKAGTDGDTIILPALPLNSPPEMLGLARGFLDHEAAHVRDTDLDLVKKSRLIPVEHHIFNTIEDWRVEKVLGEKYPGCQQNFQWLIWHLLGNQPLDDNSTPDIDILNWLLLKMRSWSVPELSEQVELLAQKINSQIPGVLGNLEPILTDIRADCPDTKTAITHSRRIVKMLRAVLQPPEGQSNGQAQSGKGGGSGSNRQSQVAGVMAGGSKGSSGGRNSQAETQSAGSPKSQPGGAGGAGNSNDSDCQPEKTDPGNKSEDAQKQPQESSSDGDLQPEKQAGQDNQTSNTPPDSGDSPKADGQAEDGQGDDRTDSQEDSQPDDPSDSQADSQRDGQEDSQDDSQDDAQADDQNASILNSLLSRQAMEMPKSIGEILADILNESSENPTSGVLEVARLGPKTFPELDDYDLKETRVTSLALKCRLTSLLQSLTLKKVQAGYQGRLDTNRLNRLFTHDPKVFRRSGTRIGLDTAVHLLLDASSSMAGRPMRLVSLSAYALCEALSEVRGISIGATVFPGGEATRIVKGKCAIGGTDTVAPILDHGQRLHRKFHLSAGGGTPMGEAIWWVMQRLSVRKEKRKIILILTDGQPNHFPNAEAAISEAQRQGFEVFGLGLKDNSIKSLLPGKSLVISDLKELPKTIFQLLGRVMSLHHGGSHGND